jgi:hypothetical protein
MHYVHKHYVGLHSLQKILQYKIVKTCKKMVVDKLVGVKLWVF